MAKRTIAITTQRYVEQTAKVNFFCRPAYPLLVVATSARDCDQQIEHILTVSQIINWFYILHFKMISVCKNTKK